MKDKHVLVAQYVAEKFGADVPVPGFWTLKEAWREWFGPGGTRPRYDRSADGIEAAKVHVTVSRPGQVVALDTTPLPVKVRDGVFGDPVSVISPSPWTCSRTRRSRSGSRWCRTPRSTSRCCCAT